ncbi:MAG: 50S ribosomal protein L19 [Planctomycetota bacterium]
MSKIQRIEQAFAKEELPKFNVGDTVDVHVLIREGEKERVQVFSGTVIRKRGSGMGATYTVRRIVQGQGLERVFPMNSPFVQKVDVKRSGRVRRSRLYFLRDRTGKATRLKEIIRARPKKVKKAPAPAAVVEAPAEPEAPAADETPATEE